jgi:hypothetical protein
MFQGLGAVKRTVVIVRVHALFEIHIVVQEIVRGVGQDKADKADRPRAPGDGAFT